MNQGTTQQSLYRSNDMCVAGVCAGIAERYDFDPIVIRILAILLSIATLGLACIVYIALWIRLPRKSEPAAPYDVTPQAAESRETSQAGSVEVSDNVLYGRDGSNALPVIPRLAVAVGLMLLFLAVSFSAAPMVSGTRWWQFWPLGLLLVGLFLIVIPIRNQFETPWHVVGVVTTSFAALMTPMSLGVISWYTIPYAFSQFWIVVFAGILLFCLGFARQSNALMIAGSFCIAAFCLAALMMCAVPGDVETLMLHMPNGKHFQIAFLSL